MRVGLISDIHANSVALDAVMRDMPPVDRLVCAGDIVGYNPMPAESVSVVRECADVIVQGNHDRAVESPSQVRGNQMAFAGIQFARSRLSPEQQKWLADLPIRGELGDGDYLTVHSHPEKTDRYVFPDQFEQVATYGEGYKAIILGHTHIQHKQWVDDTLVVNPGSVGQPRDEKPTAAYAVLNTNANSVELRRTPYNIDRVYHEIVVNDLPQQTGERLFDGQ
jgi:putative phosphoesterase